MFRMVRIQPLTDEIRIVTAGSRLCWIALPLNDPVQPGTRPGSYPRADGKQQPGPASSVIASRPSQKYGIDDRKVVTGNKPSMIEPRRQPAMTPSEVPIMKLANVVMPTSAIVHGRLCLRMSATGVGKNVNDNPRSPWNT